MAQESHSSEGLEEPGGERWEVAAEEVAQVAALTLERIETLTTLAIDTWRKRPLVVSGLLAVSAGIVLGAAIAGQSRRRPSLSQRIRKPAVQETAAKVAGGLPNLRAVGGRDWTLPARNGASQRVMRKLVDRNSRLGARYAVELLPIALTLLKNPLVRQFAWRMALRGLRRR